MTTASSMITSSMTTGIRASCTTAALPGRPPHRRRKVGERESGRGCGQWWLDDISGVTKLTCTTPSPRFTTGRQQLSRTTEEYSSPHATVQRNPSFRSANDSSNGGNPLAAKLGGMSDQDILEYMNARKDDGGRRQQQPRKSSRSSGGGSRRSNAERVAARVDDDHHYAAASEPAVNHIELHDLANHMSRQKTSKKVRTCKLNTARNTLAAKGDAPPPCTNDPLFTILPTPPPRTQKPQRRSSASKLGEYLQKVLGTSAHPTVEDLENATKTTVAAASTESTTGSEAGSANMGSHFG